MLHFFVCALLLFGPVSGTDRQFDKRAEVDYNELKHGVLIINGKLSSCELAPLDDKAAVVAASCLGYQPGTTTLDPNYSYEVLYDSSIDDKPGRYVVESITVHPQFNPSNYVNDIAVLQFNPSSTATWQGRLAPHANYNWSYVSYRRAKLTNLSKPDWWTTYGKGNTTDTICSQMSEMYEANSNDLVCGYSIATPPSDKFSDCYVPMGIAYGITNDKAFIIGPHSFSAIIGENFCRYNYQRNYFIALGNYIEFIQNTIGRKLLVGDDGMGSPDLNADYSMVDRSFDNNNGIKSIKLAGNFYNDQKDGDNFTPIFPPNSATSDMSSDTSDLPSDSSDMSSADSLIASDDLDTNSDSDNAQDSPLDNNINGLSSREKVIIGVCVSVGGVLVIALLVYIWWKKWHNRKRVDPIYQDMLQTEIGGATLPEYSASNQVESDRDIRAFLANISAPSQGAAGHQEVSQVNNPPVYNVSANNAAQMLSTTVEKDDPKSADTAS